VWSKDSKAHATHGQVLAPMPGRVIKVGSCAPMCRLHLQAWLPSTLDDGRLGCSVVWQLVAWVMRQRAGTSHQVTKHEFPNGLDGIMHAALAFRMCPLFRPAHRA
jgi:hypothetical protein